MQSDAHKQTPGAALNTSVGAESHTGDRAWPQRLKHIITRRCQPG